MPAAVNPSEQFVFDVCQTSFLSLWCLVNPQGKNGSTELCDILVVCDPHVIVVSVKDIQLKPSEDGKNYWERWTRKAVDDSIKQIEGATRWLDKVNDVAGKEGVRVSLPPMDRRIYHRIAVAFGGRREVPIRDKGEKNRPLFHVLDEQSFFLLLRHLDTVNDFTKYLTDKAAFLANAKVVMTGGEEDMLGYYLHRGRTFPPQPDLVMFGDDLWADVSAKPEFLERLRLDQESYIWDHLIEALGEIGFGTAPDSLQFEQALRTLAQENRFSRRLLGKVLREFMGLAKEGQVRARVASSDTGVGYVFFAYDGKSSLEDREKELLQRSIAALCRFHHCHTIVGISLNASGQKPLHGNSYGLALIKSENGVWSQDFLALAEEIRDVLGYFKDLKETHVHEEEFPFPTQA